MAVPSSADILLLPVTWNGAAIGIAQTFESVYEPQEVTVSTEGTTGPSARGVVRDDYTVTVEFLVSPPATTDAAPQALVIQCKRIDGTTQTFTYASMKPRGHSVQFQGQGNILAWRQKFVFVGDNPATGCLTLS
jgi:hypothetical protein